MPNLLQQESEIPIIAFYANKGHRACIIKQGAPVFLEPGIKLVFRRLDALRTLKEQGILKRKDVLTAIIQAAGNWVSY